MMTERGRGRGGEEKQWREKYRIKIRRIIVPSKKVNGLKQDSGVIQQPLE